MPHTVHVKPTTRRTRHGLVHVRGYTKVVSGPKKHRVKRKRMY